MNLQFGSTPRMKTDWSESLISDGQQFHQYKQNEQPPLTISIWTHTDIVNTFSVGNPGLGLVHSLVHVILYKYILLVRVICEKYRLRGEANFPSRLSGEENFSCPQNRYFSQIPLTNRIYLFHSAEYLTAIKTVACKQHCRLEPRNQSN